MAKGFKHGAGGGAGLNFKVVGNPKPANPKENTIWVNTDQKITGWVFSATDPTGNLAKSYSAGTTNIYGQALYIDCDLKPNTTYTISFEGAVGNNYYRNENVFGPYLQFIVASGRTVISLTTKDDMQSDQYVDGKGWIVLKNNADQPSAHVFNNLRMVEGSQDIDQEGIVWVKTGSYSAAGFNALKKNGIQVYPLSAMQYISGAWVKKESEIYQSGAWVEWVTYLYSSLNGISDLAGDFVGNNCRQMTTSGGYTVNSVAPTVTKSAGKMVFTLAGTSSNNYPNSGSVVANKTINLTEISEIVLESDSSDSSNGSSKIFVSSTLNDPLSPAAQIEIPDNKGVTLDVSKLNGNYYVGISMYASGSGVSTVTVNNLYMRR